MEAFDFHYYGSLYRAQLQAMSDAKAAGDMDAYRVADLKCGLIIREMVAEYADHREMQR